jgi:hypothetical protein
LTRSGRVEALLCGVLCLRKRGQRVATFLVFFFHHWPDRRSDIEGVID